MKGGRQSLPGYQPPAVLVGLDSMQGLQVARLLAARGVEVHATVSDAKYYAVHSRACRSVTVTDSDPDRLLGALLGIAANLGEKAVLIPCQDQNVATIVHNRTDLDPHFEMVLPDASVVDTLMDKVAFARFASRSGFGIPRTRILMNEEDASAAAAELPFPCVLKPPRADSIWMERTQAKAIKIDDRDKLISLYTEFADLAPALIAQEWIDGSDGDLVSCNVYFDAGGRCQASFVAKKIRQWPPHTGKSASGAEWRDDAALAEAIQLFTEAGLTGLGYLEFKLGPDGSRYIIEPNIGRPTGRSPIAEAGGVELHYTMYRDAAGLSLPDAREQTYRDARWVNILRDIQSSWYYWRRGELTVGGWLSSLQGKRAYAIFSWTDPVPFLAALWVAATTPFRRRRSSPQRRTEVEPS